jgi:hypothetical protein
LDFAKAGVARYVSPDICGWNGREWTKADDFLEGCLYHAVALAKYLGLSVIFRGSYPGDDAPGIEPFTESVVRFSVGVYKRFPSLVDLLRPEQLDLLLGIPFPAYRFHRVVESYRREMIRVCCRRELVVGIVEESSTSTDAYYFPRCVSTSLGRNFVCESVIDGCSAHDFPDYRDKLPCYGMMKRGSEVAMSHFVLRLTQITYDSTVVIVDVGQVISIAAIASQVSGALFYDGQPGSVKGVTMNFRSTAGAQARTTCFLTIKTRDAGSEMANALVWATALSVGNIIVIPVGLPIERLCRELKTGIRRFAQFRMGNPAARWDWASVKKFILVGSEDTRPLDEQVAIEMLTQTIRECISSSELSTNSPGVFFCRQIGELTREVRENPYQGTSHLREVLAAFAAINDFPDYFEACCDSETKHRIQ